MKLRHAHDAAAPARRQTSRRAGVTLCGAVAAFAAAGALSPAAGQTLPDVLAISYSTNPTLLAQRAFLRSVDEGVAQAVANWRPTVTVTADGGKSYVDTTTQVFNTDGTERVSVDNFENRLPNQQRLTVSQPVFRGFRTVAETESAENAVMAQRAALSNTEQGVLLTAVTAYMDVLQNQSVLELNINNEQVLGRQLEAAQDRFRVGEITRTDVSQAEARLARATSDRVAAEGDLETSRAQFANVIGQMPETLYVPDPLGDKLPASEEEAVLAAEASNPNVVTAVFNEKSANADIELVTGELLPTVSVDGEVTRADETGSKFSKSTTGQVLARISVPLYQSGSVYSRVREAKQIAGQNRVQIDEARRQAREDAITAWEALQTARAQVVAFQKEVSANEIALEGVEQEATVGSRTVLDILDAEQELLDASVNLVRARRDEVVSGYQVLTAMGRLTAQDLNLPVELYDPESNYDEVRNKWFGTGIE